MDAHVRNAEDRSRYELTIDGELIGIAEYHIDGDRIVFPHTVIDPARRGQGLGELLVRGALDDVRTSGREVVPTCWFVRDFIDANDEYAELLTA